jgi:hypothetical protein
MRPAGSDGDFERWLERELRRTLGSVRGPSPRTAQAAYRAASRSGGKSLTIRSGIFGKGAAGLLAVMLAVGGGSAVAMAATGSANPMELGQRVADIVQGCKDQIRTDDHDKNTAADVDTHAASAARNDRGIGQCVSAQVHLRNSERHQQSQDARDADVKPSPSTSPGTHQDHGQGNGSGSVGAPGQGGQGHGTGDGHGKPGGHDHTPTPHP